MPKHNFMHKIVINDLTEGFFLLRSLFLKDYEGTIPIIGDDDSGYRFTNAYRVDLDSIEFLTVK